MPPCFDVRQVFADLEQLFSGRCPLRKVINLYCGCFSLKSLRVHFLVTDDRNGTPEYSHNFFTQSLSKLEEKESVQAFTDEYRTLQSANIASQWIDKMIQYLLSKPDMPVRLLHAGGSERYSRYDFMQLMSTVFELESSLIKACLQHDLNLIPQRPSDVSLDITLAEQLLGFRPPSILHQLQQLKDSRIIY